jgi:hypothetical protein
VVGKTIPALPPTAKAEVARKLAARWPTFPPERRARIAGAPLHLALLRAQWPQLPPKEQAANREGWRQQLAPVLARVTAPPPAAAGQPRKPQTREEAMARAQKILADNQATVSLVSDMLTMQGEINTVITANMGRGVHRDYVQGSGAKGDHYVPRERKPGDPD